MGLTIVLEGEDGNAVKTLSEELDYNEFGQIDLKQYHLLKYIDYFGDTTFNSLQLEDLKNDFKKLQSVSSQKTLIKEIIDLIDAADKQVHTYIKFYGD